LNSVDEIESDSESRPDILIFNRPLAFSDEVEPLQSVVVIEFKKPDRTDYRDENPITQAYRMIREIRNSKMKDKDGRYIRPANANIPAYCYIICDQWSRLNPRTPLALLRSLLSNDTDSSWDAASNQCPRALW
jgi:hypothetical protein